MGMKHNKDMEKRSYAGTVGLLRSTEGEGDAPETIEGMAIVFNKPSEPLYEDERMIIREVIAPEAVTREFLDAQDILCTLYHDNDRILARSKRGQGSLEYEVTDEGVKFRLSPPDTSDGKTALELVRSGDIDGCSFAFYVDPDKQERTEGKENGKKLVTFTIRAMEGITDFTLTPRPAYTATEVGLRMRDLVLEAFGSKEPEPETDESYKDEVIRLRSIANNVNK